MIQHKLKAESEEMSQTLYSFVKEYNCEVASRNADSKVSLTMRDIHWVCNFANQSQSESLKDRIRLALDILVLEGIKFQLSGSHS